MSAEAVAIVGAAVGLLAVLVPLILTLHGRVQLSGDRNPTWERFSGSSEHWA